MPTFKVNDIRKRGVQEIIKMIAHFLMNTDGSVSIDEIAMGIGLTADIVRKVINKDAGKHFEGTEKIRLIALVKKYALLNTKGRQAVKALANSFGLRIIELSNDDVLSFQLTRSDQNHEGFLNALNRYGIQYKTIKHKGTKGSFMVQLWPRGERPSGEDVKNRDNKTTGNDLDGSTYIRRARKVACRLRLLLAQSKTMPASELSFELSDSLAQDKGFLQALEMLKQLLENKKSIDRDELMGWVVGRMAQLEKQIKLLEKQLTKTTQTFISPEEK